MRTNPVQKLRGDMNLKRRIVTAPPGPVNEPVPAATVPVSAEPQSSVPEASTSIRRNPVQRLRGGMNLKRRVAVAPLQPVSQKPARHEPTPQPTVQATQSTSQSIAPPTPTTPVPQQPISQKPARQESTPAPNPSGQADAKQGLYQIPAIFMTLLSGSKREAMPLLKSGLDKAKAMKDDLYAAIFEGGIAANLPIPDTKKAMEAFHRAFDISEGQKKGEPSGFLHGMVWNLYTKLGNTPEAAALMERAQTLMQHTETAGERTAEQLRQVLDEFEKLPGFKKVFESVENIHTKQNNALVAKLTKESKLDRTKSFLFFPFAGHDFVDESSWTRPSAIIPKSAGNYFVVNEGFGTVVDPDATFIDNLYRIGGVLRDVRNIVFTMASPEADKMLVQLRTFFEKIGHESGVSPIRIFVNPQTAAESEAKIAQLKKFGVAESVVVLNDTDVSELIGGGTAQFQNGSVLLALPGGKTLQVVAPTNAVADLAENVDYMIFPIDTPEDLPWVARLIKERQPKQIVFDFLKPMMSVFSDYVKSYVGTQRTIPYTAASLVFDISNGKFLDLVKVFTRSETDCWTDNAQLDVIPKETTGPDPIFFELGHGSEEYLEIVESFHYNRRRRRGLYFA